MTRIPLRLSGGRVIRLRSIRRLRVVDRMIRLPTLPQALDGLKIAHISDLHIGELVTPDRLPGIIDTTNRLGADLIAVTGDFVDLSLNVLAEVINAMTQLAAPLGVYLVPGNHDQLEDGAELVRRFRSAGLNMLVNEAVALAHHGCRIHIAGIDFHHRASELDRLVGRATSHLAGRTDRPRPDLQLMLAHHPHAFDAAWHRGVDLTLAGHTHGGQLVLSTWRGRKGSIGLANFRFRYPRGLYRRGNHYLYVTSGVGSWFPLRLRCPAEIARLTLRNMPEPGHRITG